VGAFTFVCQDGTVVSNGIFVAKKGSSPSYNLSASVGGKAYTSALCIAYSTGGTIEIESETTTSGASITYPYIALYCGNTALKTGTFNFDTTQLANYATYVTSDTSLKLAKSGSVTITSISPNVVGTFNFTCQDGTVVSSGTFVAESL
jgi:hypothetical protein